MSDPNLTIDDITALPEKMRAHAAAKAVGLSSKEFLVAMASIGVEIKSAQSGVTREALLTWFNGRDQASAAATAPAAEASLFEQDPVEKPARRAPAAKAAAEKAPAKKAPAKKAAARKATAEKGAPAVAATEAPAADTGAEVSTAAVTTAEVSPADSSTADSSGGGRSGGKRTGKKAASTTPVRRPLPEMSIVTGEVGAAEPDNRRRRSTATPSFSPLFLSPDEAAAKAEQERPARSRSSARDTAASEKAASDKAATTPDKTATTQQSGAGNRDEVRSGENSRDIENDTDSDTDLTDATDATDNTDDQNDAGEGGNRRRRRGRRGRGRGRGESFDEQDGDDGDDSGSADASDDSGDDDDDDDDDSRRVSGSTDSDDGQRGSGDDSTDDDSDDSDGSDGSASGSRRRRRRRRRSGGSGNDDSQATVDDPSDTEVHEREPRRRPARGGQASSSSSSSSSSSTSSDDEVQGITGSTRLEAKRQRRRDGREAGRRRQPILSESEFLARREAVDRVMVVREKRRDDGKGIMTQVGVLEDKVLVEHFVTTESARSMVGNVYLGRVQNVLPSMEAAFVDIGRGRNGVLYAGEVNWEAAGLGGKARRIEQALRPGDMVLVQVTKDPIGQKGARLTTQISLAGRFLVYVPDGNSAGISRKLPDTERRRLKAILKDVVPEGSGVIIRTAAEGVSEEEIGRDVERLAAQWTEISEAAAKRTSSGAGTPVALYEEPDLLVKVVRDLFNEDFSTLVIQGETSWNTVHDYVSRVAPEMTERLERYDNPDVDVFATYRVDEQLAKALDRKVWLPSGGSLVIDRTEAMTVVDVNTGKYTGSGGNLEETVTKNNLEAAEEIVRQLRLRDVGGMVVIDFIDMVLEGNRDLVLRRLTEALGRDRTRHQVSEVTSLGLVQLTRKKLGTGLIEAFSTPCEHCQGRGLIVHADPVHTESHNADEVGARRGKRRGGKGSDSDSTDSGAPGSSPAPKQTPRKDGPAPAAHPAALAISRQEAAAAEAEESRRAQVVTPDTGASTVTEPSTATATATAADATTGSAASTDPSASPGSSSSVSSTSGSSQSAPASTDPSDTGREPEADVADSADASGTRPARRRRRSTRRPADGAAAPVVAAQDVAAAEVAETPGDEAAVVAEAAEALKAVKAPEPEKPVRTPEPAEKAAQAAEVAVDAPDGQGPGAQPDSSGRRPRRRSTRREAGTAAPAAATTVTTTTETATKGAVTTPEAAPKAAVATPEAAPLSSVPVAAAPLAETPPVVVSEPRKRPARRRATRSTTAPAGGDS